ncbi:MAG: NAD(P)H-hydrate dehydratase [Acidobacteriota bacterium]
MQKVLTAEQMREVDRLTTERYGIPSILLMENAAHAVARIVTEKLGGPIRGNDIVVLCGPGNNGGDGAALARILWSQWCDVDVLLFGKVSETCGDARTNFDILKNLSNREPPFWPALLLYENACLDDRLKDQISVATIVIDCLFGTGLSRPLDKSFADLFEYVNDVAAKKAGKFLRIAVDLPSGLMADSADDFDPAFNADVTVTFTAPKMANILPPNSRKCGELYIEEIGSPAEMVSDSDSQLAVTTATDACEWLRTSGFSIDSYKNKRGHVLVIAGSESYSGAAVLVGDAAMRSGVGLVTIATPKSSKNSIAERVLPEVMVKGVAETESGAVAAEAFQELQELFEKADAVAIGSGLSQNDSTRVFVREVVERRKSPTIVDADALNLLSPFSLQIGRPQEGSGSTDPTSSVSIVNVPHAPAASSELIFTPHEGEFMRMLGTTDKDAIQDRVAAVREFSQKHNVILVLKGERVLIGEPGGQIAVNPTGNSGLGKAGNGDTLTGIIAGFVAQAAATKIDIFATVVAAVFIAGMAGDIAEKKYGKRVMTASDVRECLAEAFAHCCDQL